MWEQYKRTAPMIQLTILMVTIAVLWLTRFIPAAAVFFIAMQLGAVFGAIWAYRLKRKLSKDEVSL
jgi:hypothetical protein